jgi:hypothetical protein
MAKDEPKKKSDDATDKPKVEDTKPVAPIRSATEQAWIDALEAKSKADEALDAAASAYASEKHAAKANRVKAPDGTVYKIRKGRKDGDGNPPRYPFALDAEEVRF